MDDIDAMLDFIAFLPLHRKCAIALEWLEYNHYEMYSDGTPYTDADNWQLLYEFEYNIYEIAEYVAHHTSVLTDDEWETYCSGMMDEWI